MDNKMNKEKQYYEQTKYKNIYKNTYWGSFRDILSEEIINNSNNFIKEYDIKSHKPYRNRSKLNRYICGLRHSMFDHVEYYITNDKDFIVITSPYCNDNDYINNTLGFVKINNLYTTHHSNTYLKIFTIDEIKKIKE
jgi:hypothetical protein